MTYQLAQENFTNPEFLMPTDSCNWFEESKDFSYLDHVTKHYLLATKELALICNNHKHILYNNPKLDLLLIKLVDLLNEASSGDWYSLKEVENKGADTLLGVLDMIADLTSSIKNNIEYGKYFELERDLNQFYQRYFEN